jgi:hypothetical protein
MSNAPRTADPADGPVDAYRRVVTHCVPLIPAVRQNCADDEAQSLDDDHEE